jgi:hypothetical protein
VNPKGKLDLGDARYFSYMGRLKIKQIGAWAQEKDNREALWKKLLEITGQK